MKQNSFSIRTNRRKSMLTIKREIIKWSLNWKWFHWNHVTLLLSWRSTSTNQFRAGHVIYKKTCTHKHTHKPLIGRHNSLWFLSHNWKWFGRRDCVNIIAIQKMNNDRIPGHHAKLLNYCVAWNNQCLINTQFMMNILRGGQQWQPLRMLIFLPRFIDR